MQLPNRKTNFSEWYQEVIYGAELVDQSPVRGCFVLRPDGYALWEMIQKELDRRIKETGHQNASFPLLIPESFLKKEAEHVEGFSPELAIVTHAGGEKLEEPLVVRPTSETIIHYMFSRWIHSWRDLPIKINQWANVVRWEMRPRAFLRTTEFFWQEGHTAHEREEEAMDEVQMMLEQYRQVAVDFLAIPVIAGEKSPGEKFPGADHTYSIEGLMYDGKAVQMATSHMISRNFARAFSMTYQDRMGNINYPFLTSWGATTRLIGALIMTHGDNKGLILPPTIAPTQVIIIPIQKSGDDSEIFAVTHELNDRLQGVGIRSKIDLDRTKRPGEKFYHWELRGVPVRIEIGERDIALRQGIVVDRIEGKKRAIPLDLMVKEIPVICKEIQKTMFSIAESRQKELWHSEEKIQNFFPALEAEGGFYQTGWCGRSECEMAIKPYKSSIRSVLREKTASACTVCNNASITDILIAKSY